MRVSRWACASFAAWYSAFSLRSPHSRAVLIWEAICSRPVVSSSSSSARRASRPSAVMAFSVTVRILVFRERETIATAVRCDRAPYTRREMRRGTYSIVARDPATGDLGVAAQSHWLAVGAMLPSAEPGTGAVAVQSLPQPGSGQIALGLLREGLDPEAVLEQLHAEDP